MLSTKWLTALAALTALSMLATLVRAPEPDATALPLALNTVAGVVRTPDGVPVADALVSVELLPSAGYRSPTGALAHTVATAVTDRTGAFALTVPITEAVAAEAAFHHGTVNFMIEAIKQPAAPHLFVPTSRTTSWPPQDASLRSSLDVRATCSTLLSPLVSADVAPTCNTLGSAVTLAQDCAAGNSLVGSPSSSQATATPTAPDQWLATARALAALIVDVPDVDAPSADALVNLAAVEAFIGKANGQVHDEADHYVQRVYDIQPDTDALLDTVRAALREGTSGLPSYADTQAALETLRAWLVGAAPPVDPAMWLATVDGLRDLVGVNDIRPPSIDGLVNVSAVEALVAQTTLEADQQIRAFLAEAGDVHVDPQAALATVRAFLAAAVGDLPSPEQVRASLEALVQWVIAVPPPADPAPWQDALTTAQALAASAARLAQETSDGAARTALAEAGLTVAKVEALQAMLSTMTAERVTQVASAVGQVDLQRDLQTVRAFIGNTVAAQDPTPTVAAYVDSALDTAAFVQAQVLGTLPTLVDTAPLWEAAPEACRTATQAATSVARFAVGCVGGAAVGLHSSEFDFHDVEPTCYALGTTLRSTIEASVALAVACAENSEPTCASAKRAALDAVATAGAIAQACVDGGPLPLGALITSKDPLLALNCGATVGLVVATLMAAKATAEGCADFSSATCSNAKAMAEKQAAAVKACVVAVSPVAGAALPGPTGSTCPTSALVGGGLPLPTPADLRDRVLDGAGGFYAQMQEQDNSVMGLAMQPVNIGVLTVTAEAARLGAPGLATTPPDEPTDDSVGDTSTPLADTPSGSNASLLNDPAVVTPIVSTPTPADEALSEVPPMTANKSTPPLLPEYPLPKPDKDESEGPDDRCRKPRYWQEWIIDVLQQGEFMEPVAEVHSSTDEWVDYAYEEEAETEIGVALRAEYKKTWEVSGWANMGNSGGFKVDLARQKGTFSRQVLGEFGFIREWMTYCPYGYDGKSAVVHKERIRALEWTGGLAYSSSDLSSRDDSYDDFKKAKAANHVSWGLKDCHIEKSKGKTFKYGPSATAFGVTVTSQSTHNAKHKLKIDCGRTRDTYHFWGDKGYPTNEANHAIYAYY